MGGGANKFWLAGLTRRRILRHTSKSQFLMISASTAGGVDRVLPLLRLMSSSICRHMKFPLAWKGLPRCML